MQMIWEGLKGAAGLLASGDRLVLEAAWRSLWLSTVAVGIAAILGIPIAWLLAMSRFPGKAAIVVGFRAGMSVPTVLIGLIWFALLSRRGPLGSLDLLYTSEAILLGELCLALPIVVSWVHGTLASQDRRVLETARTLGASPLFASWTSLNEARTGIALALLTAFSRCVTELGIAMMVGGNIKYRTRTLTTATALETSKGEFERGIAMSLILLLLAIVVTIAVAWLGGKEKET